MRNVQPRVQVANDDNLDASLAPTVVVPPTPALPADQFFIVERPTSSRTTTWDAFVPGHDGRCSDVCPSDGDRGPVGESVLPRAGAGKHTSMTWSIVAAREALKRHI